MRPLYRVPVNAADLPSPGPVPVEEVFVPEGVEVANPPGGVAEKSVGELMKGAQLRLKPQPADLEAEHG